MGRKQEKVLVRHLTLEELNKKIKKEEKSVRVLERLYFIKYIYKGHTIKEACENVDPTFRINTPIHNIFCSLARVDLALSPESRSNLFAAGSHVGPRLLLSKSLS